MPSIEPTSRKEFEMDVRGYCRLALMLFDDPNQYTPPVSLEDMGRLFHHIVNRLLARHHPRRAHAKKNPNYGEWHNYARIKWLETLYTIREKRYIK